MLSKWARKLQRPGSSSTQNARPSNPEDRPPVLPTPRPRPLTPPPGSSSPSTAIRDSAFFERLPFDIRREILIQAFGAQTIHIDLVYGRPRIEGRYELPHSHRFRRAPRPTASQLREAPALHKLKPKRWRWYSCVCHAGLLGVMSSWTRFAEPCDDSCSEYGHCCSYWPGEAPHKCFIGVLGWLLACRQAYVEGMDVLWGTNTVRIQDMVILRHAHDLFLPHRWASIPHLELQWLFDPHGWVLPPLTAARPDPGPLYSDQAAFLDLLDHLPSVLGALQTLHLSLQNARPTRFREPRELRAILEEVLGPVEGMLRRLPATLRECTVAVPSSVYRPSRDDAKADGRPVEHFFQRQRERHWRELPGPTEGLEGYWLQMGKVDMSLGIVWPCFGAVEGWSWRDEIDIADEDCILYGMQC